MPELGPAAEALYREVVLEHYRRPRNRRALAQADGRALVANELCGDQVRVEVALGEGGRIGEIAAISRGCSIAVASASVMTELASGRAAPETEEIARELASLVGGEVVREGLDARLRAFARVAELPSRRRCVLLGWEALAAALADAASAAEPTGRTEDAAPAARVSTNREG